VSPGFIVLHLANRLKDRIVLEKEGALLGTSYTETMVIITSRNVVPACISAPVAVPKTELGSIGDVNLTSMQSPGPAGTGSIGNGAAFSLWIVLKNI
jgi:hypothetical protein